MKASMLVLPVVVVACAMVLILPTPSSADDSSTLFKSKCAVCHGLTGRANTPMAIKQNIPSFNSDRVKKQSALDIEDFILNGGKEKKSSHAWAHKGMSKEEGTKLATYVKQLGSQDK
jgi:mono/diheme cytochrome c family protein